MTATPATVPAEIEIEKTGVGHHLFVLTSKSIDPHLLHPFSVFALDLAHANASPIAHFATSGAAGFAHQQQLVRRLIADATATSALPGCAAKRNTNTNWRSHRG
jgi:hypothetical protein